MLPNAPKSYKSNAMPNRSEPIARYNLDISCDSQSARYAIKQPHNSLQEIIQGLIQIFGDFLINERSSKNVTGAGSTSSPPPSTRSSASSRRTSPYSTGNRKRRGDGGGQPPMDDKNGRPPRRSKNDSLRPVDQESTDIELACPFRKHDPRKYTIYSSQVCALSHWGTIARLK